MTAMQTAGVPAGVVQNIEDLMERDPQLKARPYFMPLHHPVMGLCSHPAPPIKLSKTPAQVRTTPCLGAHNYYVCSEILGMSDLEFTEMLNAGVFE